MDNPREGSPQQAQRLVSEMKKHLAEREQSSSYLAEKLQQKLGLDGPSDPAVLQEKAEKSGSTMSVEPSIDGATQYVYRPLAKRRNIRTLLLWPAETPSAMIQCSLEEINLDHEPLTEYTALSYSWATDNGDATRYIDIEIDQSMFKITTNLFDALLRFRAGLDEHPLRLWVDAVCMNQADIAEKGHQVAMMGRIYSSATRVIAWLGESGNEYVDGVHFQVMQCLVADASEWLASKPSINSNIIRYAVKELALRHTWSQPKPRLDPEHWEGKSAQQGRLYSKRRKRCPICINLVDDLQVRFRYENGLRVFGPLNRRYFSRRWVVQEILLPDDENVSIHWGSNTMSKRDFTMAVARYSTIMFENRGKIDSSVLKSLAQPRNPYMPVRAEYPLTLCEPGSALLHVMAALQHMGCSEPRDLVYSLLALASPDHRLEADYSYPVAEAFTRFAGLLVRDHYISTLFSICSGANRKDECSTLALPSWVPNLAAGLYFYMPDQEELKNLEARCQATCLPNRVLSVNLYELGIVASSIVEQKHCYFSVIDEKWYANDSDKAEGQWGAYYRLIIHDSVSGELVDNTKGEDPSEPYVRKHGPRHQDVLCTIPGQHYSSLTTCWILRPAQECEIEGAMEIVGRCRIFDIPERKNDPRPQVRTEPKLVRFHII